ncbi:MAG: hypothetical protein MUF42_07230 [Cytophagaceae bacterium]|jgi:hypothetical protein|nr:hypothetical protein [Cytophagaceae bacterium]
MKDRIVILIASVVLVLLMVTIYMAPAEEDWSDSFSLSSNKAYGSKNFYENLRTLFPTQEIVKVDKTAFEQLSGIENITNQIPDDSLTDVEIDEQVLEAPETTADVPDLESRSDEFLNEPDEISNSENDTIEKAIEYVNNPSIQDKIIQPARTSYLFINNHLAISETDVHALMRFVSEGNAVLLSAAFFSGTLADTFHLSTTNSYLEDSLAFLEFRDKKRRVIPCSFTNKAFLKPFRFDLSGLVYGNSFKTFDSARAEVLSVNDRNEITYFRIQHGAGYFYFSSLPHAFTNFSFATRPCADYASTALSYLVAPTLLWDEYYKVGRHHNKGKKYLFDKHVSLKSAWNMVLFGVLLFMLFESKRYQRLIPVYKKLRNTSVEFVHTMAMLYKQRGDHSDLAQKKIQYFLEYIRQHYYLPTHELNLEFVGRLSKKSGISEDDIKQLVGLLAQLQKSKFCSEDDLLRLSKSIDSFKTRSKR